MEHFRQAYRDVQAGAARSVADGGEHSASRFVEVYALSELATRMEQTQISGDNRKFFDALRLNWRVWTIFQAALLDGTCGLSRPLRESLLSLSNFVDKRTIDLLSREKVSADALIFINRQIAAGLAEGDEKQQESQQDVISDKLNAIT